MSDQTTEIKLTADRMLAGLAHRLRLLGYDCAIAEKRDGVGAILPQKTRAKGRILITASRQLAEEAPDEVVLVPPEELPQQAKTIVERFPLDFRETAFTRCAECNVPLEERAFEEVVQQLPPLVRKRRPDPVRQCPQCRRLYWPGTHVQRICRDFEEWTGISLKDDIGFSEDG